MSEPMMASDEDIQTAEEQERGYWLYVPGVGAGKWEEFRTAGIMALNWDRIGDPTSYPNEEAVIEALEAGYGDWGGRPTGTAGISGTSPARCVPATSSTPGAVPPRSSGAASSARSSVTMTLGPPTAACATSSGRMSVPGCSTGVWAQ